MIIDCGLSILDRKDETSSARKSFCATLQTEQKITLF
jgi:hypothetical protein